MYSAEKIDNTNSYAVYPEWNSRTWYLVRDLGTPSPTVIAVRDTQQTYLKAGSRLAKKVIAAVLRPSVRDAVKAWHEVSEKYAEFGASDTEPRAEFAILMSSVDDYVAGYGQIRRIPTTARQWQLFSHMNGSAEAARELTKAARAAVQAGKRAPRDELLRAIGY